MLSIKEMRGLVASMNADGLVAQLGPFVLIQRPVSDGDTGHSSGVPLRTVYVPPADIRRNVFTFLAEELNNNLEITTLPPLKTHDELVVGRLADCEVALDHPSVSKRHAVLKWDQSTQRCTVKDSGSTNGTFVNNTELQEQEVALSDGDVVSFGDVPFWFLHTRTLWDKVGSKR